MESIFSTALNDCAQQLQQMRSQELSTRRLRHEQDKLIERIYGILARTVLKMVNRKRMTHLIEDAEQHARIAIDRAVQSWDPAISTFSTYVHWQLRAELRTLELNMLPERRKIRLDHPFEMISLSERASLDDREGDDLMTLLLIDEQAENDVETAGMVHIALHRMERIMSHYVGNKYAEFCLKNKSVDVCEKEILKLMRNRDIYYRAHVLIQKYNDIGVMYGISRERVRQIIASVVNDLGAQFPRVQKVSKTEKIIIPATEQGPTAMHAGWDEIVKIYSAYTDLETDFIKRYHNDRHAPVEPIIMRRAGDAAPITIESESVSVETQVIDRQRLEVELAEILPVTMPTHQLNMFGEEKTLEVVASNKPKRGRPRRVTGMVVAAAGAMLMATPAAALVQSRALPPSDVILLPVEHTPVNPAATKPTIHVSKGKAQVTKPQAGKGVAKSIPDNDPKYQMPWIAKVAEFDTAEEVSANKDLFRERHPELRGLKAAVIPARSGTKPGLGYGPMSRVKADKTCHRLKSKGVSCILVRLRP